MKKAQSGHRDRSVVYGVHAVELLLRKSPHLVVEMHVLQSRDDRRMAGLLEQAAVAGCSLHTATREQLDRMAGGGRHQGILAVVKPRPSGNETQLEALLDRLDVDPLLLVLDGVQDPHNLGACLRTADAAGVHAVIAPRNRAAGLTGAVRKVAAGAAETVPFFQVTNLARTLRGLRDRGLRVVGAAGDAETEVFTAELAGPLALVMGGEGKGLRRLTREHCDLLVSLPMRGAVDSLNVSVATGVCLYFALSRRRAALACAGVGE